MPRKNVRNTVLKQVITTLLCGPERERAGKTAEDLASSVQEREAGRLGVLILLKHLKPHQEVVDHAARTALKMCPKRRTLFRLDFLDAAGQYLYFGASKPVIEAVILEMARMGFYGRLPGMARHLLGRGLTAQEVRLLVKRYTGDIATRSESTEQELRAYVDEYSPKRERKALHGKINDFICRWNQSDM